MSRRFWAVLGRLRIDEIADATGIALPEHDEYETISGLVLRGLGRAAQVSDEVTVSAPGPSDEPAQQVVVIRGRLGRPPRASRRAVEHPPGTEPDGGGGAMSAGLLRCSVVRAREAPGSARHRAATLAADVSGLAADDGAVLHRGRRVGELPVRTCATHRSAPSPLPCAA
ncbi:transporter associated domain-containing protein [Amycolatopsis sp. NPDC047767]|uniref:transporter associated domain-containing protein n=1 Tax=Amycolatopsis sp. NPDC047767 TaxID=3156765 RepID=UPI003453565C